MTGRISGEERLRLVMVEWPPWLREFWTDLCARLPKPHDPMRLRGLYSPETGRLLVEYRMGDTDTDPYLWLSLEEAMTRRTLLMDAALRGLTWQIERRTGMS